MDPNEILKTLDWEVSTSGDKREAFRLMGDLADWLTSGGFHPNWDHYPDATKAFRQFIDGIHA